MSSFKRVGVVISIAFACLGLTAYAVVPAILLPGAAAGNNQAAEKKVEPATDPATSDSNHIAREGIVVDFSITPAEGGDGKELMEGQNAEIKFRISDAATGTPLNSLYPSAWMDIGQALESHGGQSLTCRDKVSLFLKGIVGIRPMVDLNSYFLLVLNQDASISVIDPVVGMSGKTNLFATILLKRPGADWTKTRDQKRLYVTMPRANQVAVVDTDTFKVLADLDTGDNPVRLSLQPDEKYLWVANDGSKEKESSVTVIDTETLKVAANIAVGKGHHEIDVTPDNRYAFASNREDGTVTVIEIPGLKRLREIATGGIPTSLAFSSLSQALYVADGKTGVISVVDSNRLEIVARIEAKPGLGPSRLASAGRWLLVVNSLENAVFVVDTATNRLTHTIPVGAEPYQIALTPTFAHVRSLGTERVSLIELAALGKRTVPPTDYAAGASAPNLVPELGLAHAMVPARGMAMYVASPADNAIYYYMEGMKAPSGSFQTYGHSARGVEIIDRSLRQRAPGEYSTKVTIPAAGVYDVAFILDSPRLVHCFSVTAREDPKVKHEKTSLAVEYLTVERRVRVGDTAQLRFRLSDPVTRRPRIGVRDARVLYFVTPGVLRTEIGAREVGEGIYEAGIPIPRSGTYYIYVGSPSLKTKFVDLPFFTLVASEDKSGSKGPDDK